MHMEAARNRMDREARDAAWLAWHVAALTRAKKLPRFDQFLPSKKKEQAETWQEQLMAWKSYVKQKGAS